MASEVFFLRSQKMNKLIHQKSQFDFLFHFKIPWHSLCRFALHISFQSSTNISTFLSNLTSKFVCMSLFLYLFPIRNEGLAKKLGRPSFNLGQKFKIFLAVVVVFFPIYCSHFVPLCFIRIKYSICVNSSFFS